MTTIGTIDRYDFISPAATTAADTIARYDVVTTGGTFAGYRDRKFPRIVAHRDRDGVLSGIEVVVWWGGHEGRATISCKHTVTSLADDYEVLRGYIFDADVAALASLTRAATRAHTEYADNRTKSVDCEAVRNDVAAALGVESHPGIPTTREEAAKWRAGWAYEDFVGFDPVFA